MSNLTGAHHAVKFPNNPQGQRVLINEQVIGRFAQLLEAPCPPVDVVTVSNDVAGTIHLGSVTAQGGLAHGSRWLESIRQAGSLQDAMAAGSNADRYTRLMVLFTIVRNTDPQYVQDTAEPYRLWCVDFGHALTGNPDWTAAALQAEPVPANIETVGPLLEEGVLRELRERLEGINDAMLADCVAPIPDEWGLSIAERDAILDFLRRRIDATILLLPEKEVDAA